MRDYCARLFVLANLSMLGVFGGSSGLSGQELDKKLPGTWTVDIQRTKKLMAELKIEDTGAAQHSANAKMNFDANGTFSFLQTSDGQTKQSTGTWTAESVDGESDKLQLALVLQDGTTEISASVTFLADGALIVHPDGAPPAVFVAGVELSDMDIAKFKKSLVAYWSGNAEITKRVNLDQGIDEKDAAIAADQTSRMRLRIHKDGSYAMTVMGDDGTPQAINGNWSLGEPDATGKKFAFDATTEDQELKFTIWFEGDDTLVFRMKDQPASAFKRNKPHEW